MKTGPVLNDLHLLKRSVQFDFVKLSLLVITYVEKRLDNKPTSQKKKNSTGPTSVHIKITKFLRNTSRKRWITPYHSGVFETKKKRFLRAPLAIYLHFSSSDIFIFSTPVSLICTPDLLPFFLPFPTFASRKY